MGHPLRINTVDLLRRPGTERVVDTAVEIVELGVADERFDLDAPVSVHLRLESLSDGIVVSGEVRAPWTGICRRCAIPTGGEVVSEVHELYQEVITDPDAFQLVGDQFDLAPMIGEILVLDVPASPLCKPDCRGLCPICGIDLNVDTCDCAVTDVDPRWATLDQLKDDLDG